MSVDRFFVDTNVLIYAVDEAEPLKRAAANRWLNYLWRNASGSLSWQVLNEFYVNVARKSLLNRNEARDIVGTFIHWRPVDLTLGVLERAWFWQDHATLSYWDALIVAAAERADCRWLLSEDMQAGRKLGGLTILNPFVTEPGDTMVGSRN